MIAAPDWAGFSEERDRLDRMLLENADRLIRRILSADSSAYRDGALGAPTKELLGLAASLALRCDDCIAWHLAGCRRAGFTDAEIIEAMGVAALVGGTITIPHLRRAVAMLASIPSGGRTPPDLEQRVGRVLGDGGDSREALQEVCDLLRGAVPRWGWVGFYLADPAGREELVLGPFSGKPTEHVRIPFGSGVCGRAAAAGSTILVPDVSLEGNYLSCSPDVRSEIVVPVLHEGSLVGELDIDSDEIDAFDEDDSRLLERIAGLCAPAVSLAWRPAGGEVKE